MYILDRFFAKVKELQGDNSCHIWLDCLSPQGYGTFYLGTLKGTIGAHVFAYVVHYKVYPKYDVHHICENRRCVNPLHLKDLSKSKHAAEHNKFCKRGHPLVEGNIQRHALHIECRTCANMRKRLNRAKKNVQSSI